MAVDLHTHSRASDGSDPPERIVDLAVERHLTAVALTDHDTLEGIPAARSRAAETGMRLIPGVELSVEWPAGTMHLLGYWIEPGNGPLQDRLEGLRRGRNQRNIAIVAALDDMGIAVTPEEVEEESGGGAAGRPHIAAVVVRKGAAVDVADAFDRYLARGRPAYRDRPRLAAAEAIRLITESGGVSAVAHPHTIAGHAAGFSAAFEAIAGLGVDGIECLYPEYPPDVRRRMVTATRSLGLIPTGGSDYHGHYKPGLDLGIGRGDLAVPDETLDELEAARPAPIR